MLNSVSPNLIFNLTARDYDSVRPGYPDALIEDIIQISGLTAGAKALEIGCGSGQATLPFARNGYEILCLDPGNALLAIAAGKMQEFPNVHFLQTIFEDWPVRPGHFDLVYSATAFHRLPPGVDLSKAAQTLKAGGSLAIFSNQHPGPYRGFFSEVEEVYKQYWPDWKDPRFRPGVENKIEVQTSQIRSSGFFNEIEVRTYPWQKDTLLRNTCVF